MSTSIRRPPFWVLSLFLLPWIAIAVLQATDALGDIGITNAFSYMLVALSCVFVLTWWVLFGGARPRARFGLPVGLAVALLISTQFVTFVGWSGHMLPILRIGPAPPRDLANSKQVTGLDLSAPGPGAFPRFGGAQIDFRGTTRIDPDWSARAPERLWRQDVGAGWSGFAIVNGVAVTQEERGEEQAVTAYDLATGELLWVHTWPGTFWNAMGGAGPRATPTIAHGNVYALGPRGRLVCLNGADGELRWSYDVLASHGMGEAEEEARVAYGRANSPLVDGELLVVPAGGVPGAGQAGLVALDAHSGQREWASAPRQVSFASPSRVTLLGRPMLMIVNEGSVSAHHPETGALLWEHPWPSNTPADASSSQARALSGDRVFLSKGYKDGGSSILQLSDDGGEIRVSELWHVTRALKTKFTNVVFYGETAVGLSDGMLECIDLADGSRLWKNGRYGHGQVLGVGAHLLVLSEEGELLLIDPTPQAGGEVLARQQVLEGRTWNNLALSGDLLAVRNAREAAVWRLPLAGE